MKPKIFIFCNQCDPGWHIATALTEDGCFIAQHCCSDHGFIRHDMGMVGEWKHDNYNRHYPEGWELVYVEDGKNSPEIKAAHARHKAWGTEEYRERMKVHQPPEPFVSVEFADGSKAEA